jgi:hypothetical protein
VLADPFLYRGKKRKKKNHVVEENSNMYHITTLKSCSDAGIAGAGHHGSHL